MQQLAVGNPSTINYATRPTATLRNTVILARYMSAIEGHFPGLQNDAAAQQHSQIDGELRRMDDQYQAQYEATKLVKEAKATMTVAGWIGKDDFHAVLNLTSTRNEVDIIFTRPK